MKDNISPEEKLLNLIKGEKKPKPNNLPIQKPASEKEQPPLNNNLKPVVKKTKLQVPPLLLNIFTIQRCLIALMALSFGYLIFTFVYPLAWQEKLEVMKTEVDFKSPEKTQAETENGSPSAEFYLEAARNRKLFSVPAVTQAQVSQGPTALSAEGQEAIKDISLLGVISGESPQAIIEDKKTQKTYYVTNGQFIGEFQVKDIQEGKVLLNYKGRGFELYL